MVNSLIKGDTGFVESGVGSNPGALFFGGFEQSPFSAIYKPYQMNRLANTSIVSDSNAYSGKSLSVLYPQGSYSTASSGAGGFEMLSKLDSTGLNIGNQDTVYLRYMVKFQPGFQFNKTGKLPGIGGGTSTGTVGNNVPNGYDWWKGRPVWGAGGKVQFYMYNVGMPGNYGTYYTWNYDGTTRYLKPGTWHCLEMGFALNTPGRSDGQLKGWFDGQLAYSNTAFRYRETTDLKAEKLHFNTFFGGGDSSYASPQSQRSYFDNVVVSKNRIGCPA